MQIKMNCGLGSAALLGTMLAAGCSSASKPTSATSGLPLERPATQAAESAKYHPLGKFIEVAGLRLKEQSPGKLQIQFAVVNHSDAELPDMKLKVALKAVSAKKEEPALAVLDVNVPSLSPQQIKEVAGVVDTKLRVYELPDWQFLRAEFEILSPPANQ